MPANFRFCGACGLEMLSLESGPATEAAVWPGAHVGWV
jgi:hypothetical protein